MTLTTWRVDGGQLVVSCTACGAQQTVPGLGVPLAPPPSAPPAPSRLASSAAGSNVVALRPAAAEAVARALAVADNDPFAVPDGLCPKCVAPRLPAATACPHCGLVFDKFTSDSLQLPAWLETAWRSLLASWGDERRHDQLRTEAGLREALVPLGRLYRLRLADFADDPFAKRARDELVRVASATMVADRPALDAKTTNSTLKWIAVVAFFAVAILAALVMPRLTGP